MAATMVDLKIARSEKVGLGDGDAMHKEYCFGPADDRVRQVQLYLYREQRTFVLWGTAADDLNFDAVRQASLDVARSISLKS